jgi:hypothetical protein
LQNNETDLVFTGYNRNAEKSAALLIENLEKRGRKAVLVDIFAKERKKWLFRKLLLTWSNHTSAVETAEEQIRKLGSIGTVFTHSYGISGVLAPSLHAREYVLIAPPMDEVYWKGIEKLFFFLPGFREVKNKTLSNKLFRKLEQLKANGKKITFIISSPLGSEGIPNCFKDDRVRYRTSALIRMREIGEVKNSYGTSHKGLVMNPAVVEQIIDGSLPPASIMYPLCD